MSYKLLASVYTHGVKSDRFGAAVDIGEDLHLSTLNYESEREAVQAVVNTLIQHYGLEKSTSQPDASRRSSGS